MAQHELDALRHVALPCVRLTDGVAEVGVHERPAEDLREVEEAEDGVVAAAAEEQELEVVVARPLDERPEVVRVGRRERPRLVQRGARPHPLDELVRVALLSAAQVGPLADGQSSPFTSPAKSHRPYSPATVNWEPELEELRRREELAKRMGGEERVARQHASGRLTVRERIDRLFDPGSFHETGAAAGHGSYDDHGELTDFLPANQVVGPGRVNGRRAAVQGDDFTVRGGAADAAIWQKMVWAERLAYDHRMPLVRLVEGARGGGGGQEVAASGC